MQIDQPQIQNAFESRSDFEDTPAGLHSYWMSELEAATRDRSKLITQGSKVVDKYLDERDAGASAINMFNLFWANTNIMKNALYSRLPNPEVSRRFRDPEDDVARVASLLLERSIMCELEKSDAFDEMMKQVVEDRLLPGVGCAWARFEADVNIEAGVATNQKTPLDYVYWEDFIWSPARTWQEVRWVARKAYMTKDRAIERFGEELAQELSYKNYADKTKQTSDDGQQNVVLKMAVVYEIWDKDTKKVYWLHKPFATPLDERDDPFQLPEFFPCPKPMFATTTTKSTIPRSDYYMVQDQYTELNTLNARLSLLIEACRAAGVYDKQAEGVQRLMQEGTDNKLIPVDQWALFSDKGGLKGVIDWLPLEAIVMAIAQLNSAREVIKMQIYELTGISDIIRGDTKASETLGAQEIKAQYAGVKLQSLQNEVARFVTDLFRIKTHLMVKFYPDEMFAVFGKELPKPDQEKMPEALQLLRDTDLRRYTIKVDTDTFTDVDWQYQKQARTEFLGAVGQYVERVGGVVESSPEAGIMLIGLLKFAVAGFKVSREVEGLMDQGLDMIIQKAMQPKPPPPEDPMITKEKIEAAAEKEQKMIDSSTKLAIAQINKEGGQEAAALNALVKMSAELLRDQQATLQREEASATIDSNGANGE